MRSWLHILLGVVVVLAIGTALSTVVPMADPFMSDSIDPLHVIQAQSALQFMVAVVVGTIVARGRFMVAALLLAAGGWLFVVYTAYDIARVAVGQSLVDTVLPNIPGLVLYLIAAVLGTLLGRVVYRHVIENRTKPA